MTRAYDELDLCIIIPAYNEAATIQACLRDLRQVFPDATLLVVDNGSQDVTAALALAAGVGAVVRNEPRSGKGFAVSRGVQWALSRGSKWIVLHDADNEYAAHDIPALVHESLAAVQAGAPLVMGVGLREVSLGTVLWRSLAANWVARCAIQLALKCKAPIDILTGSRVFNAECALRLFDTDLGAAPLKGFELETALTRRAMKAGVTVVSSPVRYTPRAVAQKKIGASDMIPILKAAWSA